MNILKSFRAAGFLHEAARLLNGAISILIANPSADEAKDALESLELLADKGFVEACSALGITYADDRNPWYDRAKAISYWERASERDGGESMYDLALFYYSGRKDMAPDPCMGRYWMNRAAAKGQKDAIRFLEEKYGGE